MLASYRTLCQQAALPKVAEDFEVSRAVWKSWWATEIDGRVGSSSSGRRSTPTSSRLWSVVAFGSATVVQKRYGVKPRIQDRLEAASELADRLYGRAVPAVEFDAVEPGPMFIMPPGLAGM